MRTHVVQPGDSPASIAAAFAGCPKCARDLIKANPHKASTTLPNGFVTFADMRVGEKLNLPDKWGSPRFDQLPDAYFKALPHADGRTHSSLGVAAAGVLGNFALLDDLVNRSAGLPQMSDGDFVTAAAAAAAALAATVAAATGNPASAGSAQDAQASAYWISKRVAELAAALEAGDAAAVASARGQIQSVLATGIDAAHVALAALYAAPLPAPVVIPAPAPSTPVTASIPAALQTLIGLDPCAASSAAFICAAQTVLGISPDGKYGETTAAAAKKVAPSAPSACTPRPSWWAPAGSRNCPGSALPPGGAETVVAPAEGGKISTAGALGLTLLGAGAVAGAIYLATNPPKAISDFMPSSQRPTRRARY